jgi:hypothetical protein
VRFLAPKLARTVTPGNYQIQLGGGGKLIPGRFPAFSSALRFYPTFSTMAQMRAVLIKNGKSDSAKDLYIGEADKPTPKAGEVVVKVRINREDGGSADCSQLHRSKHSV